MRSPPLVIDRFDASLRRPGSEWRGRIERLFPRAAIARPDDAMKGTLTLLPRHRDLVPLSAAVPWERARPPAGSAVSVRNGTLTLTGPDGQTLRLLLRGPGVALELPGSPISLRREALEVQIAAVRSVRPEPDALFSLNPMSVTETSSLGIGARMDEIVSLLRDGCPREAEYRIRVSRLSGLGPGLTPSGDDRLVGLAAASLHFARGGWIDSESSAAYASSLARVPREHTTPVAHEMLVHASAGRFPEALIAFVSMLGDPNVEGAQAAARAVRLAAIGAQTGGDLIAGVLSLARCFRSREEAS
ncbi:MAG: DUF2877 domain-containing protein [Candidatus Eisenbacteria bacterium]